MSPSGELVARDIFGAGLRDITRPGIGRGQFLSRIVGVEERHVDHLLALEIRDAEGLPLLDDEAEAELGRDHVLENAWHGKPPGGRYYRASPRTGQESMVPMASGDFSRDRLGRRGGSRTLSRRRWHEETSRRGPGADPDGSRRAARRRGDHPHRVSRAAHRDLCPGGQGHAGRPEALTGAGELPGGRPQDRAARGGHRRQFRHRHRQVPEARRSRQDSRAHRDPARERGQQPGAPDRARPAPYAVPHHAR
mgnify:CR=1 FL=1